MYKRLGSLLITSTIFLHLHAQSGPEALLARARRTVDTLCSPAMAGRGYQQAGHETAARYLAERFAALGLEPAGAGGFFQPFPLRTHVILDASLRFGAADLPPGEAWIAHGASGTGDFRGKVADAGYGLAPGASRLQGRIALFRAGWPPELANDPGARTRYQDLSSVPQRIEALLAQQPAAVIVVQEKLTAAYARQAYPVPVLEVLADRLPARLSRAQGHVRAADSTLRSQNVLALLPGQTDTVIAITAHYDHLGAYSGAVFAGANDNASGIAMLLALAEHFAGQRPRCGLLFIAFGGEEAGLAGSQFYVEQQPLIPLSRIRFLLNLDLMGNGDQGIMAVGGIEHGGALAQLSALNDRLQAVPSVRARKNAPNSDHFFFLQRGVPGLFIYTLGGPPHYHDVHDRPEVLPLSRFAELHALFSALIETLAY
ncbi:MAG: M28 family metallopeptidase [Bacteroidia bacterium]|nr:M28 family metallopeptidase [Bacteroidia bacterium]